MVVVHETSFTTATSTKSTARNGTIIMSEIQPGKGLSEGHGDISTVKTKEEMGSMCSMGTFLTATTSDKKWCAP